MLKCRERLSARQARFMTLQFRFTTVVVRGFAHMARNGGLKGRRALLVSPRESTRPL